MGSSLTIGQSDLPSKQSTSSYWHQEPSQRLLGHHTTEALPAYADVIIIGSGITGAFAAKEAKETWAKDLNIVMLEAREACWGATGRNGGHCQPNVYASLPSIAEFEIRTFDYLKDLVEKNNIPCHWTSVVGSHSFFTQNLVERARSNLDIIQKEQPNLASAAQLVTAKTSTDDSLSLEKLRVSAASGAVAQSHAASLWPYKLVCWVLEDLLARFAPSFNLQTNTAVTDVQRTGGDTWTVKTEGRGKIVGKKVLLATNGYTSCIVPGLAGIITPVQGQVAALVPKGDGKVTPLQNSHVFLAEPTDGPSMDNYLIQINANKHELILGGARVLGAGKGYDVSADDTIDPTISAYLKTVLPEVLKLDTNGGETEFEATHEWSGTMGFSADGVPWVGRVPTEAGGDDGLWICAGYTGHGMATAALAAKATSQMMGGKEADAVGLPGEYLATSQRLAAAKALNGEALRAMVEGTVKFDVLASRKTGDAVGCVGCDEKE